VYELSENLDQDRQDKQKSTVDENERVEMENEQTTAKEDMADKSEVINDVGNDHVSDSSDVRDTTDEIDVSDTSAAPEESGISEVSDTSNESSAPDESSTSDESSVPDERDDPAELKKLLAEKTALVEEYKERLLRLQADFDNFRRRTRQEKEEIYKYASEKLVVALLPVLDNFELALAAEDDSKSAYKAGVQMIYKQLLDILEKEGVKPVPAVGEVFDPAKHEAVAQDNSGQYPPNTIVEEFRRGYTLKDKVIRASMVKVAVPLQ